MAESAGLVVEMIDDQIVVMARCFWPPIASGSTWRRWPHISCKNDRHAPLTRAEFVARSWRLALAKARELGWIA